MVKILALETSTNACSAALMVNDTIIERYQLAPHEHSELILPMLQSLLAEAQLKPSQLNALAFSCGPGSFTGVRIAAGLVQGLGYGAGLPAIPISSLKTLAQTASHELKAQNVLTAFDARMGEIYWGIYRLGKNGLVQSVAEDLLTQPGNVQLPKGGNWIGVGDGWKTYTDVLKHRLGKKLIRIEPQFYPRAGQVAKLARKDWLAGNTISADKALPVYLRSVL
jgi:tRNA threonylcarbamoyladenosine biosynthesis protein TsaB